MVSSCQRVRVPEGVSPSGFSAIRQLSRFTASTRRSMSASSVSTPRSAPPASAITIRWVLASSSPSKEAVLHPARASRHSRAVMETHRRLVIDISPFQQVRASLS